MVRVLLPVAAVGALWVGSALAQPPQPPPPPRGADPVPVRPGTSPAPAADSVQAYRVKDVLGTKVSIKGDLSIGTVDDIVFSDNGQVEYLVVANDGKLVTVPWEAAKFDFGKRAATLNITPEQFRAIPTYTAREYPTYFEPEYRTRVYGWYGLRPRPFVRVR